MKSRNIAFRTSESTSSQSLIPVGGLFEQVLEISLAHATFFSIDEADRTAMKRCIS